MSSQLGFLCRGTPAQSGKWGQVQIFERKLSNCGLIGTSNHTMLCAPWRVNAMIIEGVFLHPLKNGRQIF